jgi:uncharacterized protein
MAAGDFLGQGWAFPVAIRQDGEIALSADAEDVRQAILLLLQTNEGERVMRPDYGCGLHSHVFDPINTATIALIRHRVEDGLTRWEPRIDVEEVRVSTAEASLGRLLIHVDYRIRTTNTFYNLVYPFYLQEGRE